MNNVNMPKCLSCGAPIKPFDHGVVRFQCPECDKILIIRCSQCRSLGNSYICPNCGFKGP
ncbi:MAG: zinc finger domain-containing protein [Candidatus Hodarchaeales archaeon]